MMTNQSSCISVSYVTARTWRVYDRYEAGKVMISITELLSGFSAQNRMSKTKRPSPDLRASWS